MVYAIAHTFLIFVYFVYNIIYYMFGIYFFDEECGWNWDNDGKFDNMGEYGIQQNKHYKAIDSVSVSFL